MSTDTFVFIQIPQCCKAFQVQLKFSERVTDLVYRTLAKVGILETNDYHLFGQNRNYLEIPFNSSCRDFFLEQYDALYLFRGDFSILGIYYESSFIKVSYFTNSSYFDVLAIALICLKISDLAQNFVVYNASTEKVERLDKLVSTSSIIVKPHNFFAKHFLFSPKKNINPPNEINMTLISKLTNPDSLKSLFTTLRTSRPRRFEIVSISEAKIQQLCQEFQSSVGTDNFALSDLCCCLFLFIRLFGKPLISEELTLMAIQILVEDDYVFRIQGWLSLLPISAHSLIIEICQSFGGDLEFTGARDLINIFSFHFIRKSPQSWRTDSFC